MGALELVSANQSLLDAQLRHEALLRRLGNGTVSRIIAALNQAERELEAKIRERLGWIAARGYDASDYTLRRLEENLLEVRKTLKAAYAAAGRELRGELVSIGTYEADFQHRLLVRTGGDVLLQANLGVAKLSPDLVRAIIDRRPFQGGLLRDWARKLEADAFTRLRGAVRQGLLQGEGIDQIVRRVRGTRASKYTDGILELSRRETANVVRTASSHVLNFVRDDLHDANSDLIRSVSWLGTLDSRICHECAIRDGLEYTLDHKPIGHSIPWGAGPGRLHIGDRCTSHANLKSWRELGIAGRDATPGTRASFSGQVPGRTTFREWIKSQPAAVQDEVLGVTRAKALRAGDASFADFYDDRGRLLTLDELRGMEEAA